MVPAWRKVQTNLYEVVYVSDRISSMDDDAIVTNIVYPASRRNRELEITGCLWFDAKRFLQILEGPEDSVKTVYDAICRDTRHVNVRTLSSHSIQNRNFERWSMSYVKDPLDPTINVIMSKYQTEAEKARAPVILKRLRGWMQRRAVGTPAST